MQCQRRGPKIITLMMVAAVAAGCGQVPDLKAGATPAEKQVYLDDLLSRIDKDLVTQTETDLRAYMDTRLQHRVGPVPMMPLAYGHMTKRGDGYLVHCRNSRIAVQGTHYLDAYDMLGDKKYRDVALEIADFILKIQQPDGYWPYGVVIMPGKECQIAHPEHCRLQDDYQWGYFCYLLQAHRLTGDKKYYDAAIRCSDYVLEIQNVNGSWPDYFDKGTDRAKHGKGFCDGRGVLVGCSYNDGATTIPMMQMLATYHLTKDPKYVAKLHGIGQWMFDTQLGKGKVRGWSQQYNLVNEPVAARPWEEAIIEPRTFNRFIVPLCTWFYAMTGDERYMSLLDESVQWMDSVKKPAPNKPDGGWAWSYLTDGTPVFVIDHKIYHLDKPDTWPKPKNKTEAANLKKLSQHGCAKASTTQARQVLALWKKGGLAAVRRSLVAPPVLSDEQYLDARIEAARKALDPATLAAVRTRALRECDPKLWLRYGENRSRPEAHTAWEFIRNVRIAEGRFSAEQLATGGQPPCGGRGLHAFKVANWMDAPLKTAGK